MSDLTKAVSAANSHEEINSILDEARNEALAASAVREPRARVESAPTLLSQTEVIGGKQFTFEAESQAELNEMVANAYRVAYAVQKDPEPVQEQVEQIDPAKEAAAQAELELQFKSGQISAKDYLERSGAIAAYLAEQGVPVEELKENVEQSRAQKFTKSWADATVEFLNSSSGADWPGGERNMNLIGMKLASLGLVDAEDKVQALATAYAAMKADGMIFDPAEGSESSRTARTTEPTNESRPVRQNQQTTQASTTRQTQQRQSSSVFGASSGTSSNDMRDTSREPQKINVPSNATPEQILDAWKNDLQSRGIHPDAAFHEAFSGRK